MSAPILTTKLYIPPPRPGIVPRPRLIERLTDGLAKGCKLTLISAPAGFGKSTLLSTWLASVQTQAAWLSLDEGDRDPARFISYLISALQKVKPGIGESLLAVLQSPQPLQIENILTLLINEIASIPDDFLIVLDDYHALDSLQVDEVMEFLIEHQPTQMHMIIATREDPDLPLARLRAGGLFTELRASDLRFSEGETTEFLQRIMRLDLSEKDITALEIRTEGWIAGLQMAAISLQGIQDKESFITSFTGSHRFIMDYLLEEVLQRQPEDVQNFLLKTSILDSMCDSLCSTIMKYPAGVNQLSLDRLERSNLFFIPQDNERCWYRYHHLFASLLRKRLEKAFDQTEIASLHRLASEWYENNDLIIDAFKHAASAEDLDHAIRLMQSDKMPLHIRGTTTMLLEWLETLPVKIMDEQPLLWWKMAQMLLLNGQISEAQEKLKLCEAALASAEPSTIDIDKKSHDLIGRIAALRSNMGIVQQDAEAIFFQARRALEYLDPVASPNRASVIRDMGFAYSIQGNRTEAKRCFIESLSTARDSGDFVEVLLSNIGLADVYEQETQLRQSEECYQRILPQVAKYSILNAGAVYGALAHIQYQWNHLDTAQEYVEKSLHLAQQFKQIPSRLYKCKLLQTQLKIALGDLHGANEILAEIDQIVSENGFLGQRPNVNADRVHLLLRLGKLEDAERLAKRLDVPISRARVLLAQGEPTLAATLLDDYRAQMEAKNWQDEKLKAMVLQAEAFHITGNENKATDFLAEALGVAKPNGFIRLFVDEGTPMAELLSTASLQGIHQEYIKKLLKAFNPEPNIDTSKISPPTSQLLEPLSPRELEVLHLLAKGLSNQQICQSLFLALDTVKGHNRRIFDKLNVKSRSEAIARAHELDLL